MLPFITHVSEVPFVITCGNHYKQFVPPWKGVPVLLVVPICGAGSFQSPVVQVISPDRVEDLGFGAVGPIPPAEEIFPPLH